MHFSGSTELDDFNAIDFLYVLQQSFFQLCFFLFHEVLYLLLQSGVFVNILTDGSGKVGCVVEERLQVVQRVLEETEASFKVNTDRNLWFDYGLGRGGNIIALAGAP